MANIAALDLGQLAEGSRNSTLTWSQYLLHRDASFKVTCLPSIGQLQPRPLHSASPSWSVIVPHPRLQKHKSILPKGGVYKWMQSSSISQPIGTSKESPPKAGEPRVPLEPITALKKPLPRTEFPVEEDVSPSKNHAKSTAGSRHRIKCYTCETLVGKKHALRHLLFGKAECVKCKMIFINCLQFQEATNTTVSHLCSHSLRYLYDPFSLLKTRISEEMKESDPHGNRKLHKKLFSYIRKVQFLKAREPWRRAISDCLEKLHKGSDNEMSVLPPDKPHLSMNNVKKANGMQGPVSIAFDTPVEQVNNSKSSAVSNTEEIETGEVLLTQSYDLGHLDEIVEYQVAQDYNIKAVDSTVQDVITNVTEVDVAQDNRTIHGNAGEKLDARQEFGTTCGKHKLKDTKKHLKRVGKLKVTRGRPIQNDPLRTKVKTKRKRTRTSRKLIEKDIPPKEGKHGQDAELEFVKTPEDGYYYVVRKAIEECPICYTKLCPSRFTVNVVTFLITTVCKGCNLTIYIVYEPPDGRPPVSIVTEKTVPQAKRKKSK